MAASYDETGVGRRRAAARVSIRCRAQGPADDAKVQRLNTQHDDPDLASCGCRLIPARAVVRRFIAGIARRAASVREVPMDVMAEKGRSCTRWATTGVTS
jgi:hypothetical protein